jgi:spore coat protein U domain-containing protein, fimbrial subunit CupE1/2/3/6
MKLSTLLLACMFICASIAARAAKCTVSTSGINFGTYDVFSTVNDDITGTITVNCTNKSPYTLSLSSGSGTYASRTLKSGIHALAYNLFVDPTRLTIWGDGSAGTSTASGMGTGTNSNTPIYGRIPARQNVFTGTYSDVVTVTVTF